MATSPTQPLVSPLRGTVQWVDPVSREVAVRTDGELVIFDVPPHCIVVLRGERIKLRIVQADDRVLVAHRTQGDFFTALRIDVQPGR